MEEVKKINSKKGKAKQIGVIISLPETEEEKQALNKVLGNAYTEMAISIINRRHEDPAERKELYKYLRYLKENNASL